jgi:adenylate cyclase
LKFFSKLILPLFLISYFILANLPHGFIQQIENKFYDLRLRLKIQSENLIHSPKDVVIADIDEKSLKAYGRWPWPRSVVAQLIHQLDDYKVRAISFDMIFAEKTYNPATQTLEQLSSFVKENRPPFSATTPKEIVQFNRELDQQMAQLSNQASSDLELSEALKVKTPIVLGFFLNREELSQEELTDHIKRLKPSSIPYPSNTLDPLQYSGLVTNLDIFSHPHLSYGSYNFFPDPDGVGRRTFMLMRLSSIGFVDYPSLSLETVRKTLNLPITFGTHKSIYLGDKEIPSDAHTQIFIHYYGPLKTFKYISIQDIIDQKIPARDLENKIVLVGSSAPGIYDLRVTPISEATPGVEIHATLIQNILDDLYIFRTQSEFFFDFLLLVFLGIACSVLMPRFGALQGALVTALAIVSFILLDWFFFFKKGSYHYIFSPLFLIVILYIFHSLKNYLRAESESRENRKKRDEIKAAFGHYVSSSLVEEIIRKPELLKLGGERRELTVLFSDIRGFTTLSERLTPVALVDLLNEYLTPMTEIILGEKGMLDKYMGDAIMAVFGAPLPLRKHAHSACESALRMVEALTELTTQWAQRSIPPLTMGLGLNTGEMAVGNMGSKQRFDYTVMGDHVNLGSRLEGVNKVYGTQVIVSQYTKIFTDIDFVFRVLDFLQVKGKTTAVTIFELLARKKDASPFTLELVSRFEYALNIYRNQDWHKALSEFEDLLAFHPEDGPTKTYIERIQYFKNHPPESDWDGIFRMESK